MLSLADRVPGLQDLDFVHPVRVLLGDVYLAFRVLFVATMSPVSAMLIGNAKGVQVDLMGVGVGWGVSENSRNEFE